MVNGICRCLFGVLVHITEFYIHFFIDTVTNGQVRPVLVKEMLVDLILVLDVGEDLVLQGNKCPSGECRVAFKRDNRTGKITQALRKITVGSCCR